MNEKTIQNASSLAELLEQKPLAGFLALSIIAIVVLFGLLVWSWRSNGSTLREVVTLMTNFSNGWNKHLELEERMVELDEKRLAKETGELERRIRAELARQSRSSSSLPAVPPAQE